MMSQDKIKLMIVEDDLLIADNLKSILEDLGFDVAEPCSDYMEALKLLETNKFDVALLDIDLNGEDDGIQLGKIVSNKYKFPFIFLTAFSDKKTIALAAETKPSGYLVKPVSSATLFATIQTAIYNFQNNKVASENMQQKNDSFFVKIGNKMTRIYWNEVVSITATKNYVSIKITQEGFPEFPVRSTLQQAMNNLIPNEIKDKFIQISRMQCINVEFIKQIKQDVVVTSYGQFELGEKYKKQLLNVLNVY